MKEKQRKRRAPGLTSISPQERAALKTMAYDPGEQVLDLTKAEKLRTTALLMAINYVRETICHDAEMYRALKQDGQQLIPATTPLVLQSAVQFEEFLLGRYSSSQSAMPSEAPTAP